MKSLIQDNLALLEKKHNVEILYACEAGSRAWGFESPDSDYDIRFIYRHPEEWYLSLRERRDVIEVMVKSSNLPAPLGRARTFHTPLDFVGWDIRKALRLLKKSNPSLLEWLCSPILYQCPPRDKFNTCPWDLADMCYSPRRAAYHYYHMARGNFRDYLKGDRVRLKKYLYVIRPLLAARHIRRGDGFPPVNFNQLLNIEIANGLAPSVILLIENLLLLKKHTPELGDRPRSDILSAWIESELEKDPVDLDLPDITLDPDELDIFFRRMIK